MFRPHMRETSLAAGTSVVGETGVIGLISY
jgi:hypothetical protein